MMKQPLISIIIPMYNDEKRITRCLDSVISQTYPNFEAIVINDGSTDNSLHIAENYAAKDDRIVIISQTNSGAAMARNTGLDKANGDYIAFVDSDDYIEKDMLQALLQSIEENSSDIAICAHYEVKNDQIMQVPFPLTGNVSGQDCILNIRSSSYIHNVIWNKLYKKELWENIRFPQCRKFEDEAVLPYVYDKAKTVSSVNKALYYYLLRDHSVIHCDFNENDLVYLAIYDQRLAYFEQRHYEVYSYFVKGYLETLRGLFLNCKKSRYSKETEKLLLEQYRKIYRLSEEKKICLSKNEKLTDAVFRFSPALYITIKKLMK